MGIGHAYRRELALNHREALYAAAEILSDSIVDDLVAIREESWEAKDSYLASALPPRYLLRYTPQFIRRFHMAILTVIWKLGQREPIPLSCTAEELAAHVLIQEATAVLELDGHEADFIDFEEVLFEDTDFELLYGNAYDGIEETKFAESAGIVNLSFADWFTRFGPPDGHSYTEPHPLARGQAAIALDEPDDDPEDDDKSSDDAIRGE